MVEPLPTVLVPGLLCSPRLYADQIPVLWRHGPLTVADHTRDDSMAGIARRILASAPRRFALVGLSLGGYIAFEIMRQAAERVAKLALLDTSARSDTPDRTQQRHAEIALAESGRFAEVPRQRYPSLVHTSRADDEALRNLVLLMAEETGPETFVRHQSAIMSRPDSRPGLAAVRCPTLVLVGDGDELTPPEHAAEIADGIPGARLVTVPDCGHLSTLERPAQVTEILVEWLRS